MPHHRLLQCSLPCTDSEGRMHCSPPEELVMPQKFPRAPLPAVSAPVCAPGLAVRPPGPV